MERSNRNLWIGLGVLALVVLFALPAAGGGMLMARGFVGPWGFGAPWMWGFWGAGLLVRLLIWGGIFFVVFRLFRGFGGRGYRDYHDDELPHSDLPAGEILRRRYAAGDVTREQFEEMKRTLEPSA